MKAGLWLFVSVVASCAIGTTFAVMGYPANTWQFWLMAMPLSASVGWFCGTMITS